MNQARIKNEIRLYNKRYVVKLRNSKFKEKQVCNGFIQNPQNKRIIYINTEGLYCKSGKILIRTVKSFNDFQGENEIYATAEDIGKKIVSMLED